MKTRQEIKAKLKEFRERKKTILALPTSKGVNKKKLIARINVEIEQCKQLLGQ